MLISSFLVIPSFWWQLITIRRSDSAVRWNNFNVKCPGVDWGPLPETDNDEHCHTNALGRGGGGWTLVFDYRKALTCFVFHLSTVKRCNKPKPPSNGYIQIPCLTTYKGECSFGCNSGYFLNGSKTVSCSAESRWVPIPGRCDGKENK